MLTEKLRSQPKDFQINIERATPQLVHDYVYGVHAIDPSRIPSQVYANFLVEEILKRSVLTVKPPTEKGFDLTIALFGLEGELDEISQEPDWLNSLQQMRINYKRNGSFYSISAQYTAHPFIEYLRPLNRQIVIYSSYTTDFGFVHRDPWGQSGSFGCKLVHWPVSSLSKGEFTITSATLVGASSQLETQLFRKYSERFDLRYTPFAPLLFAHTVQPVSYKS